MPYESDFLSNFRCITQFLALLYVLAWLKSSASVDVPFNDLEFSQNTIKYQTKDAIVANEAFKKLSSHQWYLTDCCCILVV